MPARPPTASGSMPGCHSTTACPSTSMPRRPARPVSWVYSPGVSSACVSPFHLSSFSMTTVRAWHVDAQGQRLGREHHADQAGREQLLDHLLEGGEHAGVVGGDAPLQAGEPFAVAEHGEVLVGDVRGPPLHELGDRGDLVGLGEPQPGGQALLHGRVAARPAEDELDGRQQPGRVEPGDDLGPVRRPGPARWPPTRAVRPPAAGPGGHPGDRAGRRAPGGCGRSSRPACCGPPVPLRHPHQLRVDAGARRVGEQVIQPVPGHHVLPQRDRPVLVHDDGDAAAQVVQPVAELLGVADRGRQRHHAAPTPAGG